MKKRRIGLIRFKFISLLIIIITLLYNPINLIYAKTLGMCTQNGALSDREMLSAMFRNALPHDTPDEKITEHVDAAVEALVKVRRFLFGGMGDVVEGQMHHLKDTSWAHILPPDLKEAFGPILGDPVATIDIELKSPITHTIVTLPSQIYKMTTPNGTEIFWLDNQEIFGSTKDTKPSSKILKAPKTLFEAMAQRLKISLTKRLHEISILDDGFEPLPYERELKFRTFFNSHIRIPIINFLIRVGLNRASTLKAENILNYIAERIPVHLIQPANPSSKKGKGLAAFSDLPRALQQIVLKEGIHFLNVTAHRAATPGRLNNLTGYGFGSYGGLPVNPELFKRFGSYAMSIPYFAYCQAFAKFVASRIEEFPYVFGHDHMTYAFPFYLQALLPPEKFKRVTFQGIVNNGLFPGDYDRYVAEVVLLNPSHFHNTEAWHRHGRINLMEALAMDFGGLNLERDRLGRYSISEAPSGPRIRGFFSPVSETYAHQLTIKEYAASLHNVMRMLYSRGRIIPVPNRLKFEPLDVTNPLLNVLGMTIDPQDPFPDKKRFKIAFLSLMRDRYAIDTLFEVARSFIEGSREFLESPQIMQLHERLSSVLHDYYLTLDITKRSRVNSVLKMLRKLKTTEAKELFLTAFLESIDMGNPRRFKRHFIRMFIRRAGLQNESAWFMQTLIAAPASKILQNMLEVFRDQKFPEDTFDRPLIAWTSRFTQQKGDRILWEWLTKNIDRGEFNFIFLSDMPEPYKSMFQRLSANRSNIIVMPFHPHWELSVNMAADANLLTTWFEPWCYVDLKAMLAFTIPVIGNTGGICDKLNHDNAFLMNAPPQIRESLLKRGLQMLRREPTNHQIYLASLTSNMRELLQVYYQDPTRWREMQRAGYQFARTLHWESSTRLMGTLMTEMPLLLDRPVSSIVSLEHPHTAEEILSLLREAPGDNCARIMAELN